MFNRKLSLVNFWVFGDMNGDFCLDVMFVGDNGNVEIWINCRICGSGIVFDWVFVGIIYFG